MATDWLQMARDFNRPYIGHTLPYCDSSDIVRYGSGELQKLIWFLTKHRCQLQVGHPQLSPSCVFFLINCSHPGVFTVLEAVIHHSGETCERKDHGY